MGGCNSTLSNADAKSLSSPLECEYVIRYGRSLRRKTKSFSPFTELTWEAASGMMHVIFTLSSSVNYIDIVTLFYLTVDLTPHNTEWRKYVKMFLISRFRNSVLIIYGSILSEFFKIKPAIYSSQSECLREFHMKVHTNLSNVFQSGVFKIV